MKKKLSKYIDHTLLMPTATSKDLLTEASIAIKYDVASFCVKPYWVEETAKILKGTDVKTCCVIAFPHGNSATKVKVFEAKSACEEGAQEIDMVLNIGKVLEEDWEYTFQELSEIAKVTKDYGSLLKVIFETDYITKDEHKIQLCRICSELGIDYVKTSTGFGYKKDAIGKVYYDGATEHDIQLFSKNVFGNTKIKASGAIRDYAKAIKMIELGADRIGATATEAILSGVTSNTLLNSDSSY